MARTKDQLRERVLNAAEAVAIERGVNDLTLDAVAAKAKVSKGGLLYHFPSKEALVRGMVLRIASLVKSHFEEELASQPAGPGRHAHTLVRLMMDPDRSLFPRLQKVAAPLLSAMASNPRLLDPMRDFFRGVRAGMAEDGLPPERSWLILAALDGVKFWRIFGLLEPSRKDLGALRALLINIIDKPT